jgi:hypothetical protein
MTIGTTTARVSFNCNGVSTVFPIPIQAYSASDFLVLATNPTTGLTTTLVLNSDYTLVASSTDAPPKWTLTTQTGQLTSPYVTPLVLQAILNPVETQQTQYVQGQQFPSPSVQANVDRLTQMVIRLQDQIGRTLLAPDGDVSPGMALANAKTRALQYQAYDANGNAALLAAPGGALVTPASIGLALYPRTSAEITANVVPTYYFYPVVNVLRYGAIGDNIADDTAAIVAAISIASVGGGTVFFPPGSYKVSSSLVIGTVFNVYLLGAGVSVSSINPTTAVTSAVVFGGTGSGGGGFCGFSNLTINCGAATACNALTVNGTNGFWCENINIQAAQIGILCSRGVIQFFSRFNMGAIKGIGIQVNGGNDQYFDVGVISNVGFPQGNAGINITNSGGVWLTNLDVISTNVGLSINPGNGQTVTWLFAINCAFDTCSNNGIDVAPTGTGAVYGLDFTGCWTSSMTNQGVHFGPLGTSTVNGVRFNSHRSFNNGLDGLAFTVGGSATLTNVSINNSDFSGNSMTTLNTYSGITVGSGIGAFSITGCRSGQAENFGVTQARGILINAGASNNYSITGNDLRGNNIAPLLDLGTGTTKLINNNLGYNPLPSTAITVTASPFTYTNNTGALIAVQVVGGTVSAISVETQGLGSVVAGQFMVPQGAAIVVTYTVAPTMVTYGLS